VVIVRARRGQPCRLVEDSAVLPKEDVHEGLLSGVGDGHHKLLRARRPRGTHALPAYTSALVQERQGQLPEVPLNGSQRLQEVHA
jgi:transposase